MNEPVTSPPAPSRERSRAARVLWSKPVKILLMNLVLFALLMGLIELGLAMLYAHPPKSGPLLDAAREYYRGHEGDIIQYKPECAVFDPDVTYTLKPGAQFTFANREFSTRYRVNSLGVRDDEASLHAPEIILLGDSHGMGWGVEQEESFAEILQSLSGYTVLNTAISSYGTFREMRLLKRVDRSGLKYLVVQYCPNDLTENKKFLASGNKISTMRKIDYQVTQGILNKRLQPYYVGKYTRIFTPLILQAMKAEKEKRAQVHEPTDEERKNRARQAEQEVMCFLNALTFSEVDLSGVTIIVFELNRHNDNDTEFINALRSYLASPKVDARYRALDLHPLDVSGRLENRDYLVQDDHMRVSGHRKVAEALYRKIQELEAQK